MKKKIKAKKSLGQNFLQSNLIAQKIVKTIDSKKNNLIIEIGAGKGILTKNLLKKNSSSIIAIEKDKNLAEFLEKKFKTEIQNKQLKIVNRDFLKIKDLKINQETLIIGNIPYNITGKILKKIFSNKSLPQKISLMIQKEVAEKIISNKSSKLSLVLQTYGEIQKLFNVKNTLFLPKPKVDSAIIIIKNISRIFFEKNKISEKEFFIFLTLCFAQKRKTLINNLIIKYPRQQIINYLLKLNINEKIRSEDLKLNDFLNLFKKLNT